MRTAFLLCLYVCFLDAYTYSLLNLIYQASLKQVAKWERHPKDQ